MPKSKLPHIGKPPPPLIPVRHRRSKRERESKDHVQWEEPVIHPPISWRGAGVRPYRARVAFAREWIRNGHDLANAYYHAFHKNTTSTVAITTAYQRGKALLEHPDVVPIIEAASIRMERATAKAVQQYGINRAHVLEELAQIAFANMGDYLGLDHEGNLEERLADLSPQQQAALKKVTIARDAKGNLREVRFELHDKQAALTQIARMQGWDEPELGTPEAAVDAERRNRVKAEVFKMLHDMARPEPMVIEHVEATDEQQVSAQR